ncbi:hypothetical protein GCM10010191_67310 [Actinomadura vinacea]|uniref:Uncharacterized protein n=1 Tax=Actinomadura vinacea TaxID=115336 RepID=A0ABN3JVG5_9ACTN
MTSATPSGEHQAIKNKEIAKAVERLIAASFDLFRACSLAAVSVEAAEIANKAREVAGTCDEIGARIASGELSGDKLVAALGYLKAANEFATALKNPVSEPKPSR